jgi:hypothetical protein
VPRLVRRDTIDRMRTGTCAIAATIAVVMAACGGGGSAATPIRGDKRAELCGAVKQAPTFYCPAGTNRRGKPPPDGNEMWCQRWDGTRHGSYRRFPPGAAEGASAPEFVTDGAVIGEYREGMQEGAWWTRRAAAADVNVAYYEDGRLVQRVHCHP